ncbi:MinD/ParA family ATP-binding protein [Mycolicibacterium thermoresistibile]|uniref:CobQ/CobB/MinD/ParA nucleotide binding domain-containing protein n=2 Tax=Mycolicibacterium thermoresistibile TaxID=1797 RepID=G7CJ30_MYCT3|nr:MinD/ParA family protein [Mycolicibacterium thermoresistibile]EHI11430.1 hypothetical protein KEK_11063 [Mycolicibacterium thermoresistibile ATCC 19527]MCV7190550.1 MinD/ParA family protein [Mycolicibacterium thermoresistibile]GAT14086.1 ATPase [Mycolicibacterium thermoresistibile]SNW16270.1 chromosome partitioning ATPase [Mycolicibacterium thermoresistibile]
MTDRDDSLRRELGWTGPEERNYEPQASAEPAPPPKAPVPSRPPVDYPPPGGADNSTDPQSAPTGPNRIPDPSATDVTRPVDPIPGLFRDRQSPYGPGAPRPGQPQGQAPGRDPRSAPPAEHAPWPPQPGWPNQPGPPPGGPAPGQPPTGPGWSGGYPPGPQAGPTSYADRIRPADLMPPRRIPPSRGWRRLLYRASFGWINPGRSSDEIREAELEAKIKGPLRGHFKVGVMGKGGVGKTTVSASVGSVFAELRQDDRVVAIDADTAFGKLGSRVDPKAQSSYWELASDQQLETFADVRNRVGNNAAGLFVLAGETSPARRRVLDAAIYREATSRLDRHFTVSIVDCSSTMDSPVTQEVLKDLDALIVVSSPWVDGAAAAGQTLDWLNARGLTDLLRHTVIVLNDSDGHADKRTRSILAQQFASQGQRVIEVPFDGHLRPGGVINGTSEMSRQTRRRFIEIAAALAEFYPTQDDRVRERAVL